MKKITSAIAIFFILVFLLSVPISAAKPYQTYTYSLKGYALNSPDAYTPIRTIDSNYIGGLEKPIDDPRDIIVDEQLNVYIADAKNNRIVCLDRYYKLKFTMSEFTNANGVADTLAAPSGVFVTEDRIFVCDTDKNRIVTFDRNGEFLTVIPEPESTLFEDGSVYKPVAIAVDQYNRLYVVSSTTYQGIIVMTDKGEFTSLIGAQKVSISPIDIFYRRFQTDAQRAQQKSYIPTEFNNISINEQGFIYATISFSDEKEQKAAIKAKSKSGDHAPVKMLNAAGTEIMRRNGFWPPSGEVTVKAQSFANSLSGESKIIDVTIGPEKTWSIIDEKRNKVFTYDYDGNLLFAFGDDSGQQLGNLSSIEGITYQGDLMLVLDKTNDNFTVFQRTEYGDILIQALKHQNATQYDLAVDDWIEILKRNSNFDAAYIGIGLSQARNGEYIEALDYYKSAHDTLNYSDSFKEIRKEWLSKFFLLIPLGIVAIAVIWSLFMKYARKINTRTAVSAKKRTFKEEFLFVFHLIFHPFDGFWDLKHEKRGSLRAAVVLIAITIFTFFYQTIGEGYMLAPGVRYTTIISQALGVLSPIFLFAIANWCLTTLFDGEGSFKDVIIAISYSLLPLSLVIIPTTIYSNFAIQEELEILKVIVAFGYIWVGILIFLGMMVTHDYSMGKNLLTTAGSIVGIAFIMFIAMLFTTLLSKVYTFVSRLVEEIVYRL